MRDLVEFKHVLSEASSLEAKFKVIFEALIFNTFTLNLTNIMRLNLATLKVREPKVYETVKDRKVREVLVEIGMFDVEVIGQVELAWPRYDLLGYSVLFDALDTIGAYRFKDQVESEIGRIMAVKDPSKTYGGGDAVKVFLKALHVLCKCVVPPRRYSLGAVDEKKWGRLKTWLKLDEIPYVTHRRRIEGGIRLLVPISREFEKRKRTIKRKLGLTL